MQPHEPKSKVSLQPSQRADDDFIIIYTELHILRDILMHKYGREFSVAVMENRDGCVSDRVSRNHLPSPLTLLCTDLDAHDSKVVRKLVIATPQAHLVDAYLEEIARAYGVNWSARRNTTRDGENEDSKVGKSNCFIPSHSFLCLTRRNCPMSMLKNHPSWTMTGQHSGFLISHRRLT
jgi:hypothetical protein